MLRNTWESQNARAATLQDAAFELEQELGAVRIQYAAAVASLQVSLLRYSSSRARPYMTNVALFAIPSAVARPLNLRVGVSLLKCCCQLKAKSGTQTALRLMWQMPLVWDFTSKSDAACPKFGSNACAGTGHFFAFILADTAADRVFMCLPVSSEAHSRLNVLHKQQSCLATPRCSFCSISMGHEARSCCPQSQQQSAMLPCLSSGPPCLGNLGLICRPFFCSLADVSRWPVVGRSVSTGLQRNVCAPG